jgi:glycosyltransferase involved in cell wall biosynthesis
VKVTTNIRGLERVAATGVSVAEFAAETVPQRWKRNLLLLRSALDADHLVIHFDLPDVIFFAGLLFLAPLNRCRITTLDFFVGELPRWANPAVGWCLNRVARFLVYFKDTAATAARFRIPAARFHYIPFKINGYEIICATPATDEGYIFSGGRSRRDFATLFAAVEGLSCPLKLLVGKESDLGPNGSSLAGLKIPANVELLRNDASMDCFIRMLSGARLVIVPILRGSTTQAGIGVYLQAMAAGKCLIVSSGLGVSDVISNEQAMIVPAGDPAALRTAIEQAWNDPILRDRYAHAARQYALPLGGEDELRKSILRSLPLA